MPFLCLHFIYFVFLPGSPMNGNQNIQDNNYHPQPAQYGNHPDGQAMTTFGHAGTVPQGVSAPRPPRPRSHYRHTYEELPTQTEQLDDTTRLPPTMENGQGHYGSHLSHTGSHTEVDQAMLFPNSSSHVPPTMTGTTHSTHSTQSNGKRPRFVLWKFFLCYQIFSLSV